MNLNKVFLIGRLTQDPKAVTLPSGSLACNFSLATTRYFVDKNGQKREETEFHNIVLYGRLAEIATKYLKKGSLCYLEGRLRTRVYEDKNNQKRQRTEILVEKLQLGPKSPSPKEVKEIVAPEEIPVVEEEIDFEDLPF